MYELEIFENGYKLPIATFDIDVKPVIGGVIEGDMKITHIKWANADEDWGKVWIEWVA